MAKHFISVLGTSFYEPCVYFFNDEINEKTAYVQTATSKIFNLKKGDKITIFLTEQAKAKNWDNRKLTKNDIDSLKRWRKCDEISEKIDDLNNGLEYILKEKYPDVLINSVDIPEGKSEQELWDTFEIMYNAIDNDDEVIFDITHGFRSIPMQALSVLNYAKILKNINILGIYYGAFEANEIVEGIKRVPIFNLGFYNDILNWTSAANSFVNYGNSKQIKELATEENNKRQKNKDKSLSDVRSSLESLYILTNNIQTARGNVSSHVQKSIGLAYKVFNTNLERVEENNLKKFPIIIPLLEKIKKKVELFNSKDNLELGRATIRWCIDNDMTQQGFTALEETLKTYVCKLYEIDDSTEDTRDKLVKEIINMIRNDIRDEKKDNLEERKKIYDSFMEKNSNKIEDYTMQNTEKICKLIEELPFEIVKLSNQVSDVRNDINHFGFRKDPQDSSKLHKKLNEYFEEFEKIVESQAKDNIEHI